MGKLNMNSINPVKYATVKAEQAEYKNLFASNTTLTVCCPYCNKRVSVLFKGTHSATQYKCDQCGEEFIFPPVSFYRTQK